VTCEEHVYVRRFIHGQKRQTELINKLQATNIFRKVGNQWFMTYHHSSLHADSEAAKAALKYSREGGSGGGANSNTGGDPTRIIQAPNNSVGRIIICGNPSFPNNNNRLTRRTKKSLKHFAFVH
jgi:hypothetical protein